MVAYGQYGEYKLYPKEDLIAQTGYAYPDIRLYGFKNEEDAKAALASISRNGRQKKDVNNNYALSDENVFYIQATQRSGLFKDFYVLHYKPQFQGTALTLQFYELYYKTLVGEVKYPDTSVKQIYGLIEEVKQLGSAYIGPSNLQTVDPIPKLKDDRADKEELGEPKKAVGKSEAIYPGFKNRDTAFEALRLAVDDFNNSSRAVAARSSSLAAAFTSTFNWKKSRASNFTKATPFMRGVWGASWCVRLGARGRRFRVISFTKHLMKMRVRT